MIRHTVFCKFAKDADLPTIVAALKGLQQTIPGIVAITFGSDNSPEGLQKGFSHAFSVDFIDAAARDSYLPHPAHQVVGKMIVAALEGGSEGLAVVDWQV